MSAAFNLTGEANGYVRESDFLFLNFSLWNWGSGYGNGASKADNQGLSKRPDQSWRVHPHDDGSTEVKTKKSRKLKNQPVNP